MKDRIVYFDLDSTLVTKEGLNSLGEKKGMGEEITRITVLAMGGNMSQAEAMQRKMEALQPSRNDMTVLAQEYLDNITPDAREVIQALREIGIQVGIITGNFLPAIEPIAKALGIDMKHVHANNLEFHEDGSFKRVRPESSLMGDEGKAHKVREMRRAFGNVIMVGDGATDLVTQPYVDRFIGFGGVARRAKVEEGSRYYIRSESLAPVLRLAVPWYMRRGISDKSLLQRAGDGDVKRPNMRAWLRR